MTNQDVARALRKIAERMRENRDYLIQLDQVNGDGDLGISMSDGFAAVADMADESLDLPLARLLHKASGTMNEAAPSSLGTILSFCFMGMAKHLKEVESPGLADLADALDSGVKLIMQKAGSKAGEKTILDALLPAVEVLNSRLSEDGVSAFRAAADAAAEGSESTRDMRSVHGRAAYYGDKSLGVLDGGSVVGRLIFEALADEFA